MNTNWKRPLLPLLVCGALQVISAGCSSQSPIAPTADPQLSTTLGNGRRVTLEITATPATTQNPQTDPDLRNTTEFNTRFVREEVSTLLEFTGLIVGFDVENQTIRLMEIQGNFKTWIGHVTENSVLIGLEGEAVELADFGVCSQAETRGDIIDDDEFTINYLKMKNF